MVRKRRKKPNDVIGGIIKRRDKKFQALFRKYAIGKGIKYLYRSNEWVFQASSGEKIKLPAGHYMIIDGVLEQVIAVPKEK